MKLIKKFLFVFFLGILISSCSVFKKVEKENTITVNFKELSYGTCTTKTIYTEKQKNSPSGELTLSNNFKLIEQTNKIPASLGQRFGVEYILQSNVTTDIIVEQVWIFPTSIKNEKGKIYKELRYKAEKPTNDETYSVYAFDKEFEIVKGEWIFQMIYNGNLLCEKKFYVE